MLESQQAEEVSHFLRPKRGGTADGHVLDAAMLLDGGDEAVQGVYKAFPRLGLGLLQAIPDALCEILQASGLSLWETARQ